MFSKLIVQADGALRCLYDEAVDLSALGQVTIRRASCVEPLRKLGQAPIVLIGASPIFATLA